MAERIGPPAEIIRVEELCLACLREECPECRGRGWIYAPVGNDLKKPKPCPACHGSGRKCQPWHEHEWEHEHVLCTHGALLGVRFDYPREKYLGPLPDYWTMSEEVGGWYEEAEGLFSTGWSKEEYAKGRPQGFQPTPKKAVCRAYMSQLYREPKH